MTTGSTVSRSDKMSEIIGKIRRGLKKPPKYIVKRIGQEARQAADQYFAPRRPRRITARTLTESLACKSVDEAWDLLASRAYPANFAVERSEIAALLPGEEERILRAAERAMNHVVDLLGSGPVELGVNIDWLCDYKTGYRWNPQYCRRIEYSNLDRPSDVKVPWELSRMQWLIPLGQAYLITKEEKYATKARELIEHWIENNPYAYTVNWSCTMDVALRAIVWTWLFHVFCRCESWSLTENRFLFLKWLFLHGDFTARNLEESDINGNHYTADAAGLVFLGLFFKGNASADGWSDTGWNILCREIVLQTHPDGVNFESSVAYHRLVQELFLLPAMYRRRFNLAVSQGYCERLRLMAEYTAAYSRPDGSAPLWGDADDARTLPFGGQDINDHRYLLGIAGLEFNDSALVQQFSGPTAEVYWLLGTEKQSSLSREGRLRYVRESRQFPDGGFYVLQNEHDHVFVDCGPLGLAGRGGHGHNDLLSLEAVLAGERLISDCGAFQYTADYIERNNFRSTKYHNTPMVDGEEINRFYRPDYLWTLQNDAKHFVRKVEFGTEVDKLCIAHDGYRRLPSPVTVVRTISLDHGRHNLTIEDEFEGSGKHVVRIPLHLDPDVTVELSGPGQLDLVRRGKRFTLAWDPSGEWDFGVEKGRISPSFGIMVETSVLVWYRESVLRPLRISLSLCQSSAMMRIS